MLEYCFICTYSLCGVCVYEDNNDRKPYEKKKIKFGGGMVIVRSSTKIYNNNLGKSG